MTYDVVWNGTMARQGTTFSLTASHGSTSLREAVIDRLETRVPDGGGRAWAHRTPPTKRG